MTAAPALLLVRSSTAGRFRHTERARDRTRKRASLYAFTADMSSSIISSSRRAKAADAAQKSHAAVLAWRADPASAAEKVTEAVLSVLEGGGFETRVSADETPVVAIPKGSPLIDHVRPRLQLIDGLRVGHPLENGACGSLKPKYNFQPAFVCPCTDATASPGGSPSCDECGAVERSGGRPGRRLLLQACGALGS